MNNTTFADLPESEASVEKVSRRLRATLIPLVGEGEAAAVGRLIFEALKGWSATDLIIHAPDTLSPFILSRIDEILVRLRTHEPIQYILGKARFFGMDFDVDRSTLIPRPETEELVELIVKEADNKADLRVLDIGTGSGAIAIALSRNLRFPQVEAIDISREALAIAEKNAARLHANIRFIPADIFSFRPQRESLDIIVSNPPYICEKEKEEMESNVLDYEPHTALFVPDADPLLFYRCIARIGREALSPGGRIYFEINPIYAENLKEMMTQSGYSNVQLIPDISHRLRFLSAILPANI